MRPLCSALCALALAACGGTTGGSLVTFDGRAGGPSDAAPGMRYLTAQGYDLTLDRAMLHLGAVYLNENRPLSGAGHSGCVLPGIYVAQLFGPLDLDLLSPALVDFPTLGQGTSLRARTAEVWLLEGDIGRTDDSTVVFDVAGTASKGGLLYPFTAQVTLGQNRALPPPNAAEPGANPICEQRIVSPIAIDLRPFDGARLTLRIDPRAMFDGVDFSLAPQVSTSPPAFVIPDEKGGIGEQLFSGLRANARVYAFDLTDGGTR